MTKGRYPRSDSSLIPWLAHALDKRDLIDLLQSSQSQPDFVQRRLTQEPHALFARCTPDFRRRLLSQNHLANAVTQIQQFMDRRAASKPRAGALNTPLAFVERHLRPLLGIKTAGLKHVRRVMYHRAAGITDQPHQ